MSSLQLVSQGPSQSRQHFIEGIFDFVQPSPLDCCRAAEAACIWHPWVAMDVHPGGGGNSAVRHLLHVRPRRQSRHSGCPFLPAQAMSRDLYLIRCCSCFGWASYSATCPTAPDPRQGASELTQSCADSACCNSDSWGHARGAAQAKFLTPAEQAWLTERHMRQQQRSADGSMWPGMKKAWQDYRTWHLTLMMLTSNFPKCAPAHPATLPACILALIRRRKEVLDLPVCGPVSMLGTCL